MEHEDEEELVQPKFYYKRILNDVAKVWNCDAASCMAAHPKFLALGTQWGKIYLLDHCGNAIHHKSPGTHSTAVNCIDIDKSGDYLASCANDGKVMIFGLWSTENNRVLAMDRPVHSVALNPNFGRSGGQQFVTGERVLTFHEKGLLGRAKQSLIYSCKETDGFIHCLRWYGLLIAFANDSGIRVYDQANRTLITHVQRQHDITLRCDIYPAHIVWLDESYFAVGWANSFTLCHVKSCETTGFAETPGKFVEIEHVWDLSPHYVCGVSCKEPERFFVFLTVCSFVKGNSITLDDAEDEEKLEGGEEYIMDKPKHPRYHQALINKLEYDIINEDIIELQDCQKLLCHNYHLQGLAPTENFYFVLAPKELISVRPCTPDDHVAWLIENKIFDKALEFMESKINSNTSSKGFERYTVSLVAKYYIDFLLNGGKDFELAASLTPLACGSKKTSWEEYVTAFEYAGQLGALAPFLPVHSPQLDAVCYEVVLLDFLQKDILGFKDLLHKWPCEIYHIAAIIQETLQKLQKEAQNSSKISRESEEALLESLAMLYMFERTYDRAIALYLKLQKKVIFQVVEKHQLFDLVKNKIQELMHIDKDLAVRLLLNNEDCLPAKTVVTQLLKQPILQLAYLDRLFARGEGTVEFADLAVKLYSQYDRKRLLPFLRSCEHYKLDKALKLCEDRKLLPEKVFLLARAGSTKEALKVLIRESGDVDKAIDFCQEHDDQDLWKVLIDHSIEKPRFIKALMGTIGMHVDPALLISVIPPKMEIECLQDSLVKILRDFSLQISLQEGCRRMLLADCYHLTKRLYSHLRTGIRITPKQDCNLCQEALVSTRAVNVIRCNVGVVIHENCSLKSNQRVL